MTGWEGEERMRVNVSTCTSKRGEGKGKRECVTEGKEVRKRKKKVNPKQELEGMDGKLRTEKLRELKGGTVEKRTKKRKDCQITEQNNKGWTGSKEQEGSGR